MRAVGLMAIENLFRYPALAVGLKPSASQGEARLRGTRTPTATLSTIGYRLSAIGSVGQSPPVRNANSNGDPLDHWLSVIGYRLCGAKPACAERELQQ